MEALAEKHRMRAAWVDVISTYAVNWWQYRLVEKGEPAGVVINLKPTGRSSSGKPCAGLGHDVMPAGQQGRA
jgi:hypothetical protein